MTLRKLYTVGLTLSYLLTSTYAIGQSKLDILVEVNNQIKTLQDNQDHPGRLTTDLNTIVDWHNNQIQPQRAVIKGLEEDIIRQEQLIDSLLAVQTEASNLSTIWQDSLDHAIIVLAELRDQLTQQKQSAGGSGNRTDSCYCIRFPWSEVEREMQGTIAHRAYMDTLELCGLNFTDAVHNYESNILQNPLLDERWDLLDLELSHQDTVNQQACIQRNEDHLESIRRQEQINREAREAHEAQLKEAQELAALNESLLEGQQRFEDRVKEGKWKFLRSSNIGDEQYFVNYSLEVYLKDSCQPLFIAAVCYSEDEYDEYNKLPHDNAQSDRWKRFESYLTRRFGSDYRDKVDWEPVSLYYEREAIAYLSEHPYIHWPTDCWNCCSLRSIFEDGPYYDLLPFQTMPKKYHVPVVWLKRCD